ncbi:hypothetical protein GH714_006509 [Hevea brasiliensis]|uniref:GAG-pre-integrase domain-containing protein n=1 Tax=Hevea brasiliensis TaxID=3981 RepID=A0A6A6MCF3_HEVBR|nr:hypothetical protein GH714_006509 [Hevea brasiliensis]
MLTKSNYAAWAIKMEVFMMAQGVWEPIESEGLVDKRRDKMALAAIYQGIGEDTLLQLGAKKTAKEAWNTLKVMNQGAEKVKEVRAQTLWREFEALRMGDSETVEDFSGKLTIIVNKLRSLGEPVEDEKVIKKMLRSTSSKFLQIVSAIEEFSDLKTKSVEEEEQASVDVVRGANRLYIANLKLATPINLLAKLDNESWAWHARFGHLNFDSLRKLSRKGMVKGLPSIDQANKLCDGCLVGKQHRTSFPKQTEFRASRPLELVHSDLCGPISPTTCGGENQDVIENFKSEMQQKFDMTDLGLLSFYLGIEVKQTTTSISICQTGYAKKILEKMGVGECNPCKLPMEPRTKLSKVVDGEALVDATLYRSLIGSLRYLVNTRPDITFSVGVLSRFMEKPTTTHMAAVKQVLRYIKGTLNSGCVYSKKQPDMSLVGYCDSDLAGDIDDRKSTTGILFFLGSSPVTWVSQNKEL